MCCTNERSRLGFCLISSEFSRPFWSPQITPLQPSQFADVVGPTAANKLKLEPISNHPTRKISWSGPLLRSVDYLSLLVSRGLSIDLRLTLEMPVRDELSPLPHLLSPRFSTVLPRLTAFSGCHRLFPHAAD